MSVMRILCIAVLSLCVQLCMADAIRPDSIMTDDRSYGISDSQATVISDSLATDSAGFIPDVLANHELFRKMADSLTAKYALPDTLPSLNGKLTMKQKDSLIMAGVDARYKTDWTPVPRTATILSMLIPGGGQIYNRKFWKLPIFYGGYVGCIYALSWNNQTYSDYMQAYQDIMDDDPNTKSYEDLLPPHYDVEANKSWLKDVLKTRKDSYRRYRDISIFCFAGVYLLSVIDAYVDAELSHFDVSKDLSLHINPGLLDTHTASLGLNFSLTF